jgi:biofilm PGA synthesis N-glycosyltransferase PgaC
MKEPSVSIIIPAHNEEKTIGAVIISLLKQKYDKKEIIVVNDGSIDRTEDIINNFPTVKKINNHRNLGLAKSMNNGIKEAKGQIVIVLHADCIPKDNFWVKKMIEPFTDSSVGAVISQRIVEDRSKLNIAERLFDSINPQSLINKNKNQ